MLTNDLILHIAILLIHLIVNSSSVVELENGLEGYNEGDEECYLSANTERIQIAIAADVTGSNIKNIRDHFRVQVKNIVQAVNSIHDGTEFAITIHVNWEQSAFKAHNDPEGCYKQSLNFTTDVVLIENVARNLKKQDGPRYPGGGDWENGLPAVAFTAADSSIGWIREDIDKNGKNIHRFIVLFTDKYSIFKLTTPGNRTPFKGDGSDTCSTSLSPTEEMVGKLLKKEKILVIGVFVKMSKRDYDLYIAFFQKYEIPNVLRIFGERDLVSHLVDYFRDSVKKQLQCVFDDPPAYNTLGL